MYLEHDFADVGNINDKFNDCDDVDDASILWILVQSSDNILRLRSRINGSRP